MEKKIIEGKIYPVKMILIVLEILVGVSAIIHTVTSFIHLGAFIAPFMDLSLMLVVGFLLFVFWKIELTVTDKRVVGVTTFNRKIDLPLDSVSAIGTSVLKGISVATSSGKISFLFIKNAEEIRNELNKLIINRQEAKANTVVSQTTINQVSNADELKKYKDLLDAGVITQEEFDAKKKQILGL